MQIVNLSDNNILTYLQSLSRGRCGIAVDSPTHEVLWSLVLYPTIQSLESVFKLRIRLSTIGNVSCTMQYTLYRRACRRVFPIGNVLRKTVPRRTVFSTDDGVTTRFCSFSSLLLLRAAKNTVILLLFYFSVKLIAIAIANSTFIILHYIHNVTIS